MVHGFPADFSWNQLNQCNECEHSMSFKMKPGPPQIPGIALESSDPFSAENDVKLMKTPYFFNETPGNSS